MIISALRFLKAKNKPLVGDKQTTINDDWWRQCKRLNVRIVCCSRTNVILSSTQCAKLLKHRQFRVDPVRRSSDDYEHSKRNTHVGFAFILHRHARSTLVECRVYKNRWCLTVLPYVLSRIYLDFHHHFRQLTVVSLNSKSSIIDLKQRRYHGGVPLPLCYSEKQKRFAKGRPNNPQSSLWRSTERGRLL